MADEQNTTEAPVEAQADGAAPQEQQNRGPRGGRGRGGPGGGGQNRGGRDNRGGRRDNRGRGGPGSDDGGEELIEKLVHIDR
ncbi:MAG: 30S ribosomal protein S5, partial [Sphingomonadales bacterium]